MKNFSQFIQQEWVYMLIIAAAVMSAYSFALNGDFKALDDRVSIVDNEMIHDFRNVAEIFTTSFFKSNTYYRPLVHFSFMWEYMLFGLEAYFYYLTNIFLHVLCALTVFKLLKELMQRPLFAFAVTLLYALHPVHWEAVGNIAGRAILLCALFTFNALYWFMRAPQRRGGYLGSLVFFTLALLCKESAVTIPFILLSYRLLVTGDRGRELRHTAGIMLPFFVVLGLYFLLRQAVGIMNIFFARPPGQTFLEVLTFLLSVLDHISVLLVPQHLVFERAVPIFKSVQDPQLLLTVLVYALALGLLYKCRRFMTPVTWFLLLFFWIDFIPVSQVLVSVTVHADYISAADHFLYIPALPFVALAVMLVEYFLKRLRERYKISGQWPAVLVLCVGVFYFTVTVQHVIKANDQIVMYSEALANFPHNNRVRNSLAMLFGQAGFYNLAEKDYRAVLDNDPLNRRGRIGLGKALVDQGRVWDGIREYEKIADAGSLNSLLIANLAEAYNLLQARYKQMAAEDPGNPQVYYSLGIVQSKLGNLDQAVANYNKALTLKPDYKNALFNLAALYEAQKNFKDAAQYFEQMLAVVPADPDLDHYACLRLAHIYANTGEFLKAADYQRRAKELKQ